MLADDILNYVLIAAVLNTVVFLFTSYVLFFRYGLPVYHIMGFYQLYHFLGFVARPWELYLHGFSETWDWIGATPDPGTIMWATFIITLAHLSMLAGFVMTNPRFGPVPGLVPINFKIDRPVIFGILVTLFVILGIYASYKLVGSVLDVTGEHATALESDAQGGLRTTDVSGYQTVFFDFLTITMITLYCCRRTRKMSIVLIVAFIAFRALAGTGRSGFVAVALAVGFVWLINKRLRLPTPRMIGIGLALLLLFNIVGADRSAMRRVAAGETTITEVVTDYFNSDDQGGLTQNMAEFDVLASVLSYVPNETGYTFGTQYLRIIIWPIPRFLWQDKPVFTSIVDLLEFGNFRVLTYTMYADSYMTLGTFGMIIIVFGISCYINMLYRRASRKPTPLLLLVYFVHLIYATILFRDGPVSAAYFYLVLGAGAMTLVKLGGLTLEKQA